MTVSANTDNAELPFLGNLSTGSAAILTYGDPSRVYLDTFHRLKQQPCTCHGNNYTDRNHITGKSRPA
jgi:hypothetical protein